MPLVLFYYVDAACMRCVMEWRSALEVNVYITVPLANRKLCDLAALYLVKYHTLETFFWKEWSCSFISIKKVAHAKSVTD